MANVTISGIGASATTVDDGDLIEIEQGGVSKKATAAIARAFTGLSAIATAPVSADVAHMATAAGVHKKVTFDDVRLSVTVPIGDYIYPDGIVSMANGTAQQITSIAAYHPFFFGDAITLDT